MILADGGTLGGGGRKVILRRTSRASACWKFSPQIFGILRRIDSPPTQAGHFVEPADTKMVTAEPVGTLELPGGAVPMTSPWT
jgi:hypothetical protein